MERGKSKKESSRKTEPIRDDKGGVNSRENYEKGQKNKMTKYFTASHWGLSRLCGVIFIV